MDKNYLLFDHSLALSDEERFADVLLPLQEENNNIVHFTGVRFAGVRFAGGSLISETISTITDKVLNRRPKVIRKLLKEHGDDMITGLGVCRVPVQSTIKKVLNVITLGTFKRRLKQLNYDDVFHLYLIVQTSRGTWSIEKNQRVTVSKGMKQGKGSECKTQSRAYGITLNTMFRNAEVKLGLERMYRYSAFRNNCQRFVFDLLNASGLGGQWYDFILQKADTLAPNLVKTFANKITDAAGVVDYIFKGGGS